MMKFRCDKLEEQDDGSRIGYALWMGGRTLSCIRNCPTPFGRRTVYATNVPDTYFSIPAVCRFRGRRIHGWIGVNDGVYVFHPYIQDSVYPYAD